MRLTAILLSTVFVMTLGTAINAKDEGSFSGKWVLDKNSERTANSPVNLVSKIKQDGSRVTIESTFKEPENGVVPLLYLGIMTTQMKLSLDGDTSQNQIGPFQMASKTTMNGTTMETEWTAEVKGDQVQGHWTHTLDSDGKHMTLAIKESSKEGQGGEATLHFVRK